jgi:hypothetical protein
MKKPILKCVAKTHTIQQGSNQEWDTLKVQILAKISASLNPKVLDINDYTILFHIPQCSQTRYLSHEAGGVQCYDCTGYKDQESDGIPFGYAT